MYRLGIAALVLIFLGTAVHYVIKTDRTNLLDNPFASYLPKPAPVADMAKEPIAGEYLCDLSNGCSNIITLTLNANDSATLESSYDTGVEIKSEKGRWDVDGSKIVITIYDVTDEHPTDSHVISIDKVSTTTLSQVTFDKKLYPDMRDPQFIRK
jgi:hypothetical protein